MAVIEIKSSTVIIAEKDAVQLVQLLIKAGVEFNFIPAKNPNPQQDILLKDVNWCVRESYVVKQVCERFNLDFQNTSLSTFVENITREELSKTRNCGKRALEGIEKWLYRFGYSLA